MIEIKSMSKSEDEIARGCLFLNHAFTLRSKRRLRCTRRIY